MAELVEGAGLENQKGGNPFEGSNPSLSAKKYCPRKRVLFFVKSEGVGNVIVDAII